MKKLLISIGVAVGVYFAFSNTIDEFLYPEKRPGLNTYNTYTTTTQQTTTAVTQQTPIVTDEDGYEPRDDNNHKLVKQLADEIKSLCDQCGYGESETIRETANFVQSIEYVDDMT